jgi:hypothetical protein
MKENDGPLITMKSIRVVLFNRKVETNALIRVALVHGF